MDIVLNYPNPLKEGVVGKYAEEAGLTREPPQECFKGQIFSPAHLQGLDMVVHPLRHVGIAPGFRAGAQKQPDAIGMLLRIFHADLSGSIRGSVFTQADFVREMGLLHQDAVEAFADVRGMVVGDQATGSSVLLTNPIRSSLFHQSQHPSNH